MTIASFYSELLYYFVKIMETELKPGEFKCEQCDGIFKKGWSEEEAIDEQRRNFNEEPKDDDAILCDDCYRAFMAKIGN